MTFVMIQDNIHICPECKGGMRKVTTKKDILFVCKNCNITLKVVDRGQSERELKCERI